jgi:hypothetical protein
MRTQFVMKLALVAVVAMASMSPALAARRHMHRTAGACGQSVGRCIADCDQLGWCQMYTCSGGNSTPVPFWRCYEPSGLCFAPHC